MPSQASEKGCLILSIISDKPLFLTMLLQSVAKYPLTVFHVLFILSHASINGFLSPSFTSSNDCEPVIRPQTTPKNAHATLNGAFISVQAILKGAEIRSAISDSPVFSVISVHIPDQNSIHPSNNPLMPVTTEENAVVTDVSASSGDNSPLNKSHKAVKKSLMPFQIVCTLVQAC